MKQYLNLFVKDLKSKDGSVFKVFSGSISNKKPGSEKEYLRKSVDVYFGESLKEKAQQLSQDYFYNVCVKDLNLVVRPNYKDNKIMEFVIIINDAEILEKKPIEKTPF